MTRAHEQRILARYDASPGDDPEQVVREELDRLDVAIDRAHADLDELLTRRIRAAVDLQSLIQPSLPMDAA